VGGVILSYWEALSHLALMSGELEPQLSSRALHAGRRAGRIAFSMWAEDLHVRRWTPEWSEVYIKMSRVRCSVF
jgi:hypothetical protein